VRRLSRRYHFLGKFGIFAGLRVESTKESFDAFAVDTANNIQPISSSHRYTDFLPSLQTRYEFTPNLIARAIYSSTIGRPGFNQLSPSLNINLLQNSASQGNPDLKPTHSHNIDLSIEDYLAGAGILSFGVFYKDLQDYIVSTSTTRTYPNNGIFAGLIGRQFDLALDRQKHRECDAVLREGGSVGRSPRGKLHLAQSLCHIRHSRNGCLFRSAAFVGSWFEVYRV
jgi:TonB-dependent receptor